MYSSGFIKQLGPMSDILAGYPSRSFVSCSTTSPLQYRRPPAQIESPRCTLTGSSECKKSNTAVSMDDVRRPRRAPTPRRCRGAAGEAEAAAICGVSHAEPDTDPHRGVKEPVDDILRALTPPGFSGASRSYRPVKKRKFALGHPQYT